MGSNRRRTGGPQNDELDSAGSDGEFARRGRSLKRIDHAVLAVKAMVGSPTWLEVERRDGCAREAGRPVAGCDGGRSQSLHCTETVRRPVESGFGGDADHEAGVHTLLTIGLRYAREARATQHGTREGRQGGGCVKSRQVREHERRHVSEREF